MGEYFEVIEFVLQYKNQSIQLFIFFSFSAVKWLSNKMALCVSF